MHDFVETFARKLADSALERSPSPEPARTPLTFTDAVAAVAAHKAAGRPLLRRKVEGFYGPTGALIGYRVFDTVAEHARFTAPEHARTASAAFTLARAEADAWNMAAAFTTWTPANRPEIGAAVSVPFGAKARQNARVVGFNRNGRVQVRGWNASRGRFYPNVRTVDLADLRRPTDAIPSL